MPIREHPLPGTILVCDFDSSFKVPEMVKPRPVVVLSPKIAGRPGLCTVVALSSTPPNPVMSFHCRLELDPPLPRPWSGPETWVKGDMVLAVGFHRLDFVRLGKDQSGKRIYRYSTLTPQQLATVRKCVLCGIGLAQLARHL